MSRRPIVVVGDALLDRDLVGTVERLCPDAPAPVVDEPQPMARPGGAALAAALAVAGGRPVVLVTAIGEDQAGRELLGLLGGYGLEVVDLGLQGPTPEKVRIRADGRTLVRLDHGGAPGIPGRLTPQARAAIRQADAILVSDYGRGITASPPVRRMLASVAVQTPVVWDPHPRGGVPVPGATLATPNRTEVGAGPSLVSVAQRADALRRRWRSEAVAVTLGAEGALLVADGCPPQAFPAEVLPLVDSCGAGDSFAATVTARLAAGDDVRVAVGSAVSAASAFVGAGGAAGFAQRLAAPDEGPLKFDIGDGAERLAAAVRARGGRVVATGGCFDLIHAGHISVLRASRALGDCLIVCLNSDSSVRRLKGPGRPLVTAGDRAEVLAALGCVDAVAVFDEDTPASVLERIRPDIFTKGGDYSQMDLPERSVLERWGGQVMLLPYLEGHSTSRLVQEARRAGA